MDIFEQITALVDGEIRTAEKHDELLRLIDTNEEYKFEFGIQSLMKTTVRQRLPLMQTPAALRNRILNLSPLIDTRENTAEGTATKAAGGYSPVSDADEPPEASPEELPEAIKEKPKMGADGFFFRMKKRFKGVKIFAPVLNPRFAFGTLLIAGLLGYLAFPSAFSSKKAADFISSDSSSRNMLVQAQRNFSGILSGSLLPQIFTDDDSSIRNFFKEKGVHFDAVIPRVHDWKLFGARVSEDRGEKFAHHIYKTSDGKIIYFYQADEACVRKNKVLSLSDDAMQTLQQGKYYRYQSADHSMIALKCKNNICVVVSNEKLAYLDQAFASLNNNH